MKKTFILFIILFVLFPLSACKEPNFKEATLTIDKKEKTTCDESQRYPDRVLITFTFAYIKDDLPENGYLEVAIWRDISFAINTDHPIYWTHFVSDSMAQDVTLKSGYTFTFQVCAPEILESITFDYSFHTNTHGIYKMRQTIELKKDE